MPVTGHLARPTRAAAWKQAGLPLPPLFDLAPGGVYLAAAVTDKRGALLPHPFTLTHAMYGRFAFCGTFPRVAPAGRYPAPCLHGARTFLPRRLLAHPQAAIRPADPALLGFQAASVKRKPLKAHRLVIKRCKVSKVEASATPSTLMGRKCR